MVLVGEEVGLLSLLAAASSHPRELTLTIARTAKESEHHGEHRKWVVRSSGRVPTPVPLHDMNGAAWASGDPNEVDPTVVSEATSMSGGDRGSEPLQLVHVRLSSWSRPSQPTDFVTRDGYSLA